MIIIVLTDLLTNHRQWQLLQPKEIKIFNFVNLPLKENDYTIIIDDFKLDKIYPVGVINWSQGYILARASSKDLDYSGYTNNYKNVFKEKIK